MDLEVVPSAQSAITLFCDNSGAVANSEKLRSLKRGKHIERKYHLIREIVNRDGAKVIQIKEENNILLIYQMTEPCTKITKHGLQSSFQTISH